MENSLLSDNITVEKLRQLLKTARDILGKQVAIRVGVSSWYYDVNGTDRILERIEVYYSTGGPTREFSSLEEAYSYLGTLGKVKEGGELK